MPKPKNKKPTIQGKCIFCSGSSLSKEHIWPKWSHPLLDKLGVAGIANVSELTKGRVGRVISHAIKERQGPTYNRRLRVVCETCNNVWMGSFEGTLKPILTPLICGELGTLDASKQKLVAQWAVLKTMVNEQTEKDEEVFTEQQRREFMANRTIPSSTVVWIGRSYSGPWLNAVRRCSANLTSSPDKASIAPLSTPITKKNVQTTALGVGQLFIYVMVSNSPSVQLQDYLAVEKVLVQIWPTATQSILLPLHQFLTPSAAENISLALDHLLNTGHRNGFVLQGEDFLSLPG